MLVSGGLLGAAYGLHPWWPAAWLAPIPVLAAAFSVSARAAWWLACGAGLIGGLTLVPFYLDVMPPAAVALTTLIRALIWGTVVLLTRRIVLVTTHWTRVFVFPVLWAAVDTLVAAVSPHGSAGSLAYSQMDALPVIQVAALAGAPGIVFVVMLFASLVAVDVDRRRRGAPSAWRMPLLVLVVALGYGAGRLAIPDTAPPVTVGLAALDVRPGVASGELLWTTYSRAIDGLAERGARIVVLPEKIDTVDAATAPALQRRLGALAEYYGVSLVAGVTVVGEGRRENRAWLFGPTGALAADYSKQHLIPGIEAAFAPGRTDAVQVVDAEILGVAICKDLDFPALGQRYGVKGTRLMLVPAWDFRRDDWQHARMAVLRGVEGGFTVVRAARDGLLTISDRYGRVLAEAASAEGRTTLISGLAPRGAPTIYVELGDAFGWVCVVLALIAWLRAALQRGEETPAS